MKKYIISLLLFLAITTKVSSLGDDFKNSLTKIDLKKVDDTTYQVELFVQNPYFEPVKVVKRSDTSYYILLPETKTNISASANNSDITSIDVKSFPYMGQSVNNGYTKVALTTSKPINFTSKVFFENNSKLAKIDTNKLAQIEGTKTDINTNAASSAKVNLKPSKDTNKAITSTPKVTSEVKQKQTLETKKAPSTNVVAVAKKTTTVKTVQKTTKKVAKAPINKVKVAPAPTKKVAPAPVKEVAKAPIKKIAKAPVQKPKVATAQIKKTTSAKAAPKKVVKTTPVKKPTIATAEKPKVAAAVKIPDEIINEQMAKVDETNSTIDENVNDVTQTQAPFGMHEIIKKNILLIIASLALLTAFFTIILNNIGQIMNLFKNNAKKKEDESLGLLKIKEEAEKNEILENAIMKNKAEAAQEEETASDTPKTEYDFSELLEDDIIKDNATFVFPKEPDSSLKTRLDISKLKGEENDEEDLQNKIETAKAQLETSNIEKANRLKQIRDKKRQVDEILEGTNAIDENKIEVSLDEIITNSAKPKIELQSTNATNSIISRKTYYNDGAKDYTYTSAHPRGTFSLEKEQVINLDRVEVQSPIKSEPANRGDEAKILSSIEVENDRGFYIASYNGREVLAGHIEDKVFIICTFREKLKDYNLKYRLLDSALERDYYMIKVDDKKIIVKSTTENLKLEAKVK